MSYYCDGGSSVTYTRGLMADHGSMAMLGAAGALIYLKDRLDGNDDAGSGCSTDTVISS
jgi:ureidoglycolate hydrolase